MVQGLTTGRRVLVTGATGFVGRAVLSRLGRDGAYRALGSVRRRGVGDPDGVELVAVGELEADTNWAAALHGVDAVVHTAARVHVMRESATDPLAEFRRVNVAGTLALARQAAAAGVRRFVFVSSIKVNGEGTGPRRPYRADDPPAPVDPYGVSKLEAEQGLRLVAADSGMDVTIIRPVLVYGPGVKGNFLTMLKWIAAGVPLPLGRIDNARSLVALDNLVDLIVCCLDHPAAAGGTFLVSDGDDVSTTVLLRRLGEALRRPARLLPVPAGLLLAAARLSRSEAIADRLCGSLQVDIEHTRTRLSWVPPVSMNDALRRTADHFIATRRA
jgi:nucleoside-diphosphate-sugar epimerase